MITKETIEDDGSEMIRELGKLYPHYDSLQIVAILAYSTSYVLHSITNDESYRRVGALMYSFLITNNEEKENAPLPVPTESTQVSGSDQENGGDSEVE